MESHIAGRLEAARVDPALRAWITDQSVRGLSYSLTSRRIQKLWLALTGDLLTQATWWSAYQEGTKRRNRYVHKGDQVGEQDATAFLAAAAASIAHLNQT
jgi:hypothetical protein